jgi:Rrf2 family nitric oxide-sensitive transcriptional repressor
MRLTSFTDYSLRVLLYLAAHPDNRATIAEIAGAFGISENHLMKVAHFLGKENFLTTSRGKNGGLSLARPAEKINLGQVVRLTEVRALPAECFDRSTNTCVITPVCQLKGALMEAVKAFNAALDRYTLADVVGNRDALGKILFITMPARKAGRARAA